MFSGNVEVVRQLVDRGLDEHHRDNAGWTPLHYAAFEGLKIEIMLLKVIYYFEFLNTIFLLFQDIWRYVKYY